MTKELEEFHRTVIDELLAEMSIEERLEGLTPEQRVQGLSAEQLADLAKKLKNNGSAANGK